MRPGEISRAHCGVLLLDEFPLFRADVINALRQPLESGDISIARAEESVVLPARSIVVLAANPCPCGNFHPDASTSQCSCKEVQRRDYRRKVTGPITDRIDITRHLTVATPTARRDPLAVHESTAQVRARVEAARARQADRYADQAWRLNGHAPGPALARGWPMTPDATRLVDDWLWSGKLTRRGVTRVHRLAWTVADLAEVDRPGVARGGGRAPAAHRSAAAGGHGEEGRVNDDRLARLALSQLGEPGDLRMAGLVAELGAARLYEALLADRDPRGVLTDVAARLESIDPERDLDRAGRLGIRWIVPGDPEWPTPLDDLEAGEPLQEMGGVPLGPLGARSAPAARARRPGRDRRLPVGHDLRHRPGGRARGRTRPGRLGGRLRRGVRDRPGRAPGSAGRRRSRPLPCSRAVSTAPTRLRISSSSTTWPAMAPSSRSWRRVARPCGPASWPATE